MYIGQPLARREDDKFLTGRGRYVDDIDMHGCAHVAFVRSAHAHGRIRGIETGAAAASPGVLDVLTAADWRAAGLGALVCEHPMPFSDGRPMNEALRPAFAADRVRHVGDVIAAVVAEDAHAAADAAEIVAVDIEPLPAVTDVARALDADAPVLHPQLGSNLVFEVVRGDLAAPARATSPNSSSTATGSRATRWSRAPISPITIRRPAASLCGRPARCRITCAAGSPITPSACRSTASA